MADVSTAPRLGGYADRPEEFDPTVLQGLRAAAIVLLCSAAVEALQFLSGQVFSLSFLIDIFLGVQLLRVRYTWKIWALARAWGGVALVVLMARALPPAALVAIVAWQAIYSASIILFLTGTPTRTRLVLGWVCFGITVVLFLLGAGLVVLARIVRGR